MKTFNNILEDTSRYSFSYNNRIIKGSIYNINKSLVHVDLGLKSTVNLDKQDIKFLQPKELRLGGQPLIYVGNIESSDSLTTIHSISHDYVWELLEKIHELQLPILGRILGLIKGGGTIGLLGFTGFMPHRFLFNVKSNTFANWLTKTKPVIGDAILVKIHEIYPSKQRLVLRRYLSPTK
jgi:ribosomal protein S1